MGVTLGTQSITPGAPTLNPAPRTPDSRGTAGAEQVGHSGGAPAGNIKGHIMAKHPSSCKGRQWSGRAAGSC